MPVGRDGSVEEGGIGKPAMLPPSTQAVSNQMAARSGGRASTSRAKAAVVDDATITPPLLGYADVAACSRR